MEAEQPASGTLPAAALSALQFSQEAEASQVELDFSKAETLYAQGLAQHPSDSSLMDSYADFLLATLSSAGSSTEERIETARKLLMRSIELAPEKNPLKYFSLAETFQDKQAVELYYRGIELLEEIATGKRTCEGEFLGESGLNGTIASAYASIAELLMTTELSEEPDAEERCEECLKRGLDREPNSVDILQNLANLRIMRMRDEEALELMRKVSSIILEKVKKSDLVLSPPSVGLPEKRKRRGSCNSDSARSFDFKMQTVRLLI